ncbi:hypothetical protein RRG08_033748 [Elysia crispata]|uniref:Uncharacterized protein n=1 Tax=Elysia crispata TaxID=231223 RepID=A0AAE1AAL2_9GAST|nr:hypothetical protein RRG08_033748 [Elysia crispata]
MRYPVSKLSVRTTFPLVRNAILPDCQGNVNNNRGYRESCMEGSCDRDKCYASFLSGVATIVLTRNQSCQVSLKDKIRHGDGSPFCSMLQLEITTVCGLDGLRAPLSLHTATLQQLRDIRSISSLARLGLTSSLIALRDIRLTASSMRLAEKRRGREMDEKRPISPTAATSQLGRPCGWLAGRRRPHLGGLPLPACNALVYQDPKYLFT